MLYKIANKTNYNLSDKLTAHCVHWENNITVERTERNDQCIDYTFTTFFNQVIVGLHHMPIAIGMLN